MGWAKTDFSSYLNASERYIYIHRKKVAESEQLFKEFSLIQAGESRLLWMDFTLPWAQLADANIVKPESSQALKGKTYSSLSWEEKSKYIFEDFYERLTHDFKSVVHIDHHYPYPLLSDTSTSVLASDFLLWIYLLEEKAPKHIPIAKQLLSSFEGALSLLDHSDADILLSQFMMRRALNKTMIRNHALLMQSAALYNDYLREPVGTERFRHEVQVLFLICQSLENDIQDGKIQYSEAFERIATTLSLIERLRTAYPGEQLRLESFLYTLYSAGTFGFSDAEKGILEGFKKRYGIYHENVKLLSTLQEVALRHSQDILKLPVDSFSKIKNIVVVRLGNSIPVSEASMVARYLRSEKSDWIKDSQVLVALVWDKRTSAYFIKLRTLDSHYSLDTLYPQLRKLGLDAGGRASAGAAAYGKSGSQSRDESELLKDLESVVHTILGSTPTGSCEAPLLSPNLH